MATLKISDISVGDWVGIDLVELNMPSDDLAAAYIEKLLKPIRIKGISEDSDMVLADIEKVDEKGSIMMKCEHLRSIPITAEILERNGFESTTKPNVFTLTHGKLQLYVSEESDGWYISFVNFMERLCILQVIRQSYIHELQHALRLAGVEKEINL